MSQNQNVYHVITAKHTGSLVHSLQEPMFKIMIDIEGTITYAPEFFKHFTRSMKHCSEVHIVTARHESARSATEIELAQLEIFYHKLAMEHDKVSYVINNDINVVFEDSDYNCKSMPENVLVLKIRGHSNFHFREQKWA